MPKLTWDDTSKEILRNRVSKKGVLYPMSTEELMKLALRGTD